MAFIPSSGSVAAWLQSDNASVITVGSGSVFAVVQGLQGASVSGTVINITQGSVATVIIGGSISATFTPPANQSVSGTIQTDVRGSVATVIIGGSISATFTPPANQSVSGVVMAQGLNAPNASVTGNPVVVGGLDPNGSVQGAKIVTVVSVAGGLAWLGVTSVSGQIGSSTLGTVPVTQVTSPWLETFSNSSIIAINAGSVVTLSQGSVISLIQGSVAAVQSGTRVTSISGAIFQNAPTASWVSGVASTFTGVIQPIIAAQGASIFTYITGVQVANASANNAYLTFYGATSSVVGFTIAPANGGSNIVLPNAWKTNANGAFSASVSGVASVFLSAEGFTSNT